MPARVDARCLAAEIAEETAGFIGRIRKPKEKAKVRSLVLSLLLPFFEKELVSLWTTRTSSDEPSPDEQTRSRGEEPSSTTGKGKRTAAASGVGLLLS